MNSHTDVHARVAVTGSPGRLPVIALRPGHVEHDATPETIPDRCNAAWIDRRLPLQEIDGSHKTSFRHVEIFHGL